MNPIINKLLMVMVFFLAASPSEAAEKNVNYSVKIIDATHHLAEITVLFPATDSTTIDFIMPSWRLGRYKLLNLADGIRQFRVTDVKGSELKVKKIDTNTWRISIEQPTKLAVSYQLYANQLETRARHIDDSHAYLDGVSSFIYSPEFLETPVTIALDVPNGWRSRSGMTREGNHQFSAKNYHVLASSPIETGIHEFYSFAVDDRNYDVVIWGKGNFDGNKIVEDFKKMVLEHGKMYGGYPFNYYLFIIHASSGATGATEHLNSTVIQRDALSFSSKKDYQKFISTSSHEFLHTWNVKSYRPVGIAKYDYTKENYSDLLWISEGSTSYLGDLLLVKAGLLSAEDYLQGLAKNVETYLQRPGRKETSVQQASFNAWIDIGGDRANNSTVNIYSKGNLLSLLMDVELLKSNQATLGYAHLHKLLYERFPVAERGFSALDITELMNEISGKDFTEFWQQYMESVAEIDFDQLFLALGLTLSGDKTKDPDKPKVWTGMSMSKVEGDNRIAMVPTNSPAWNAGLAADDILVAINSIKVEPGKLDLLLSAFKANDEIKVTFFRRNILKEATMQLSALPFDNLKLEHLKDPTDLQKSMYEKWLGVDWPKPKELD